MRLAYQGDVASQDEGYSGRARFTGRGSAWKRKLLDKGKVKAEEALFLMNECGVPMYRVAKRLRLSMNVVRLLKRNNFNLLEDTLVRKVHRV
jgi:hypothetical protein